MDLNIEAILAQLGEQVVSYGSLEPEIRDGRKKHHNAHHPLHDPADQPQVPTIGSPSPPLMSWDLNNVGTDVALRRSSRWHPAYYADFGSNAAVIWAAVEAETRRAA
jgi:hypothetical protein